MERPRNKASKCLGHPRCHSLIVCAYDCLIGIPPSLCLHWHHSLYKWTRPFPSNFSVCRQPKPEPRNKASKCLSLLPRCVSLIVRAYDYLLALFSLLAGKYRSYFDQNGWVPCLSTDIHMFVLTMSCDFGQLRSSARIDHMKTYGPETLWQPWV